MRPPIAAPLPTGASTTIRFYDAAIGKKAVMAVTGIVLFGYVLGHMVGNLQIFAPANIGCVERLEMPDYPMLPRQLRIQGIQTVKVVLSEQAAVQTVETSIQARPTVVKEDFFREHAEKALKNSRFSKTCGGKTITLVFHYEFREDENKSLAAFGPPNHFWIRAGPFYVMPEVSVK